MRQALEGSQAIAQTVALCRPQVVAAYPITPQTHIVENIAKLVADGKLDCEYISVESEFSAASVVLGAFAEIGISRQFALRPEVNYVVKGTSSNYVVDFGGGGPWDVTEEVRLGYLQIPVLANYILPVEGKLRPSIFAGPAVAFNLTGKSEVAGYGDSRDGDKDIANVKGTDFSMVFGAAVSFPLGKETAHMDVNLSRVFFTCAWDSLSAKLNLERVAVWTCPREFSPVQRPVMKVSTGFNCSSSPRYGLKTIAPKRSFLNVIKD